MQTLDWIFLGVVLLSTLIGAWRGLVYEVLSLLSWVAAFVLAQWLAADLGHHLPMGNATEPVRHAAAFVLVFIGSLFVLGLLTTLVKKFISAVGLRPVDRILGAAFGALRALVLLLAVTAVVGTLSLKNSPTWRNSSGAQMLMATLKAIGPLLPEEFGKYLLLKDD